MLADSLRRTREGIFGRALTLLGASNLDAQQWDNLESMLVQSDIGIRTASTIIERLRTSVRSEGITSHIHLNEALARVLTDLLPDTRPVAIERFRELNVVLIVGVNGSGKTTTVAKLAKHFQENDWRVMLAAADTFRAAAIEQLKAWGDQLGVPVVAGQLGSDTGAVVFDAIRAAHARSRNLLLIDTAGRLHTKYNLMEELKKLVRVCASHVHQAPHEVWLVLDGTTGQNALNQAARFTEAVSLTGIILTKLDGSAKGAVVFAIGQELGIPVRYIGVGEGKDDLVVFKRESFVESLLQNIS